MATPQRLSADCCELGEGPAYDPGSDTLWWFDILGHTLFEHRFATATTLNHNLPRMASALAPVDGDRHVLVMEDGLYLRRIATGSLTRLTPIEADRPDMRSNDARVHPSGAMWVGTMGKSAQHKAGAIYHCADGKARALFDRITIPNSICFSPDGRWGYFADTALNILWRVRLDPQTGLPLEERDVFLTGDDLPLGGRFDGSVTDAEGSLWNAAWGGGSVSGFSPGGHLIATYEVPAAQSSCPAFVGPRLDRLAVTTAWEGQDEAARAADPGAGYCYIIDGAFKGKAEPEFRLPAGY